MKKVVMLKNAFKPFDTSRAGTILERDEIVPLEDEAAKVLIEKGKAKELKAEKKEEKTEEKSTEKTEEKTDKKSTAKK